MMLCEKCGCKEECGWYQSYNKILTEVYTGIGTDNTLGRALIATLGENELKECSFFEEPASDNTEQQEDTQEINNKMVSNTNKNKIEKWVYDHWCHFVCSKCGFGLDKYLNNKLYPYCPMCGSQMKNSDKNAIMEENNG